MSKKGMIHIGPMDVCTRNLWQKVERGKITGGESTTRFPQASCLEKPMRSLPEIWGPMYNIPAWSANMRSSTMSLTTLILCQVVLKYMF